MEHQAACLVELGGQPDRLALGVTHIEHTGGGLGEIGDGAGVANQSGVAGAEDGQEGFLDLTGGGHAACVLWAYMRWSAMRRASAASVTSVGSAIAP